MTTQNFPHPYRRPSSAADRAPSSPDEGRFGQGLAVAGARSERLPPCRRQRLAGECSRRRARRAAENSVATPEPAPAHESVDPDAAQALAHQHHITVAEATERLARQQSRGAQGTRIEKSLGGRSGGIYLDRDGKLVVTTSTRPATASRPAAARAHSASMTARPVWTPSRSSSTGMPLTMGPWGSGLVRRCADEHRRRDAQRGCQRPEHGRTDEAGRELR